MYLAQEICHAQILVSSISVLTLLSILGGNGLREAIPSVLSNATVFKSLKSAEDKKVIIKAMMTSITSIDL